MSCGANAWDGSNKCVEEGGGGDSFLTLLYWSGGKDPCTDNVALQCSTVQCSAVQYSAVQCSAVQCSAVQCSAV